MSKIYDLKAKEQEKQGYERELETLLQQEEDYTRGLNNLEEMTK